MTSKVAIVRFDGNVGESLKRAIDLIDGIADLDSVNRPVVVKVGIFSHKEPFHTSVSIVDAIINTFDRAPRAFIVESDNYRGTGSERLQQVYGELFGGRVSPFDLTQDTDVRHVKIADERIGLSHILFKPNVLLSTHILRTYEKGSILKNLLGLIPDKKKVRFHRKLEPALADVYEAIGGIDLAVMDGTYSWQGLGYEPVSMNTLLVGRDAVAVEAVGGTLAGLDLLKMPILQEFAKRGLGEADLKNIEIVGSSFESLVKEFEAARKTLKKRPRPKGPQTWGGRVHNALKSLMQDGFFNLPNRRTAEDAAKALEAKGIPAAGKEEKIAVFLSRRVKTGILKKDGSGKNRVYWKE